MWRHKIWQGLILHPPPPHELQKTVRESLHVSLTTCRTNPYIGTRRHIPPREIVESLSVFLGRQRSQNPKEGVQIRRDVRLSTQPLSPSWKTKITYLSRQFPVSGLDPKTSGPKNGPRDEDMIISEIGQDLIKGRNTYSCDTILTGVLTYSLLPTRT